MATGSVSAIDRSQWQLIESKSASGTSVTFNAFSGYKHLWLTGKAITKSGTDHIAVRPNNNSTQGNYANGWNTGQATAFLITGNVDSNAVAVSFKINDIDTTGPKQTASSYDNSNVAQDWNAFIDTSTVTSLVVYTNGGSVTFSGGTFYLYGIVA